MAELQVLRRSNVFKELTMDVAEKSLVVHYAVESVLGDASGTMVNKEQSSQRKRIRLKDINPETDVAGLADAIMKSTDIIPSTKKGELVLLLKQLQDALATGNIPEKPSKREKKSAPKIPDASAVEMKDGDGEDAGLLDPTAKISAVDEYLEQLYEEDVNKKIAAAAKILALAHKGQHLQELVENEVLVGALSRVLKEDYKKSTELTLTIMQVFFCFAHFKEMHPFVVGARMGDLSLRIIDLEERRHAARMADLERFSTLAEYQARGDAAGEAAFRKKDAADRDRDDRADSAAASGAGEGSESKTAEEIEAGRRRRRGKRAAPVPGEPNVGEDGKDEGGPGERRIKLKPLPAGPVDINRELRKASLLTRRSEGLLYVCIHLLLNLAEDLELERKMCKRGIVGLLTPLLERDNAYLLLLVINFLRKLSIFEENKDAMVAQNVGPRLVALLPDATAVKGADTPGEVRTELFASVLHLMFNLTFDLTMCQSFINAGALGKVGAMLRAAPYRAIGLKLLYRLSVEYNVRGQFAGTDAVSLTFKMVGQFPGQALPQELAALAVNLTQHPATAAAFLSKPDSLKALVGRLAKTGDPAVAKILRGLAWYTYSCQADAEMKAHAQEDARRMREAAVAKATKKKKKAKKAKKGKKGKKGKGGEGGGGADGDAASLDDGNITAGEMNLDDAPVEAMLTSHIGSYMPEPNEPLPYEYQHAGFWSGYVPDVHKLLLGAWERGDEATVCELLGLFANLTPLDAQPGPVSSSKNAAPPVQTWSLAGLAADQPFMTVLCACLRPGPPTAGLGEVVDPQTGQAVALAAGCAPSDDVLLEALQVVSALALDPGSAPSLMAADVHVLLAEVLGCRLQDPDLLMQAITAILRMLHHGECRDGIVNNTDIPARACDLLGHPHPGLAAEADDAVTLMVEHDREFGTAGLWRTLQARRFAIHNREWFSTTVPQASHGGGRGGEAERGRHGGATTGSIPITGEAPDAYVQDDSYGHEDDLDGAAQVAGLGTGANPGSPLHHMGKHGEAVAFDVSYLYNQAAHGPGVHGHGHGEVGADGRRQRSPSEVFDYWEEADAIAGEEGLLDTAGPGGHGGRGGADDDADDDGTDSEAPLTDDVRELMAQYMARR